MLGFFSIGEFITSEGEVYLCARGFSSVGVYLSFCVVFTSVSVVLPLRACFYLRRRGYDI